MECFYAVLSLKQTLVFCRELVAFLIENLYTKSFKYFRKTTENRALILDVY